MDEPAGGAEGPQLPVLGGVQAEKEYKCSPFQVVCPARGSVGPPLTMPFPSYEGLTWCWEAARAVAAWGKKLPISQEPLPPCLLPSGCWLFTLGASLFTAASVFCGSGATETSLPASWSVLGSSAMEGCCRIEGPCEECVHLGLVGSGSQSQL